MNALAIQIPSLANLANNLKLADLVGTAKTDVITADRDDSTEPARAAPEHAPLPRLDGVPDELKTMIRTAHLFAVEMNLDTEHAQAMRELVAEKWATLRIKDGSVEHVVILRWSAKLGAPGFRVLPDWNPESLDAVTSRLISRLKRLDETDRRRFLADLRDVRLITNAEAGKLLLG